MWNFWILYHFITFLIWRLIQVLFYHRPLFDVLFKYQLSIIIHLFPDAVICVNSYVMYTSNFCMKSLISISLINALFIIIYHDFMQDQTVLNKLNGRKLLERLCFMKKSVMITIEIWFLFFSLIWSGHFISLKFKLTAIDSRFENSEGERTKIGSL